jgi:hypothetical protein
MNRKHILPVLLSAVTICIVCKNDNPKQNYSACAGTETPEALWPDGTDPHQDSMRMPSLFDRILQCEETIAADPADQQKARRMLCIANDTTANCFYVIGKGAADTALPENARPASQKLTARFSAEKWALYCKSWAAGEKITCREPVAGKILFMKELLSRASGDTLFTLFMVPVGSVVVKH